MKRRSPNGRAAAAWTDDGLANLTLQDFRRLERALHRHPGYLDEELYWWLVEEMLKRLAAAEPPSVSVR
jgi:hypothetical protein